MAETAKILSPDTTVILANPDAGCPMADMVSLDDLIEFKENNPNHLIVSYVNTSADIKAQSDMSAAQEEYNKAKAAGDDAGMKAAEEKYKGVQKVFGHISAIEKDHNGELRLLFNVGSFDRLYAYGLSKNEIMRLRVPDRVDLHCMGFEMNSVGDINGICSMIDDPYKFIAISTVQYREAVNKLTPPKQFKTEWDLLKPFYNKEVEQNINENCAYIDSTNMEGCYSLINDLVDSSKLAEIKHKRQLNK